MALTKAEFFQFTKNGQLKLLNQYGLIMSYKQIDEMVLEIYKIHNFLVEVAYRKEKILHIRPVLFNSLLNHYSFAQ